MKREEVLDLITKVIADPNILTETVDILCNTISLSCDNSADSFLEKYGIQNELIYSKDEEAHELSSLLGGYLVEALDYSTFRESANPLLKYLNENHHPHVTAIITTTSIELLDRLQAEPGIYDYVID